MGWERGCSAVLSWARFKEITLGKIKLYSHFCHWIGIKERGFNLPFLPPQDFCQNLQKLILYFLFHPVVCYASRPRRPGNNITGENTMPKRRPTRSSLWRHLGRVGTETAWARQRGTRLFSPSLAFLRAYNKFQPIKEVIKHTRHREGVSLMRSARSGALHLPERLICFPIPPLLFPLRPN